MMSRSSIITLALALGACSPTQPAEGELSTLTQALSQKGSTSRGHGHGHGHGHHHSPGGGHAPNECGEADAGDPGDGDGEGEHADAGEHAEPESCCGFPGDSGNSLGVGRFCETNEQCEGTAATFCSSAENGQTDHQSFYCTLGCDPDDGTNPCGEGAVCACEEVGCGCTPVSCIDNPPEGCTGP